MGHYVDEGECAKHGEWSVKHASCPECDDDRYTQLAEARAEIERLRAGFNAATDLVVARDCQIIELTIDKNARIAELEQRSKDLLTAATIDEEERRRIEAECEELRADVVWAYCELASDDTREFFGMPVEVETDNEARRAVREARNGVS